MIGTRSTVALLCVFASAAQGAQQSPADAYFSGTVIDAQSQPLAGVIIQAGHEFIIFTSTFIVDGEATTDADGNYAITTLADNGSGKYILAAQLPGYAMQMYPSTPCYVPYCLQNSLVGKPTVAPPLESADFQLVQGVSLSGQVTDGVSGEPVSGPLVHVERIDGKGVAYSNADSTGHYEVFDLYPGEFRVYTSQLDPLVSQVYAGHDYDETMSLAARNAFADTIVLAAGETAQGVDFALNAGAHISGSVTSAINGAALNAYVSLRRLDASGTGAYVYAADTQDSGSSAVFYASPALASGTFKVSFGDSDYYIPQWYSLAASEAQATVVSLSAGENRTGIDALLTPTRTVSGTIFDAGTLAPLAGRSVHAGYRTILLPSSVNAVTDVNGHYLLQGFASGYGYTVWVEGSRGYQGAYYSSTPDGLETKVTLGTNENATGIDIALPRGAYASGQVHDPKTGAGSANLTVRLYHPDGSTVYDIDGEDQTASDSAGNYHTASAPPGSYYLGVLIGQALFLYPGTLCGTPCDFTTGQLLDLSLAQEYPGLDISVAHLDDVFGDGFD